MKKLLTFLALILTCCYAYADYFYFPGIKKYLCHKPIVTFQGDKQDRLCEWDMIPVKHPHGFNVIVPRYIDKASIMNNIRFALGVGPFPIPNIFPVKLIRMLDTPETFGYQWKLEQTYPESGIQYLVFHSTKPAYQPYPITVMLAAALPLMGRYTFVLFDLTFFYVNWDRVIVQRIPS